MSMPRGARIAALAVAAVGILAACGEESAAPSPSAQGSPSPPSLACTQSGPASTDWPAPDLRTPTVPPLTGNSLSGDSMSLFFERGTPAFEVTPQSTTHFTEVSGRGAPVDVQGTAGVLIILRGFRGDMANYVGATDFYPNGTLLKEVRFLGDYEGVIGFAIGLGRPACANVTESGSTLTFRFISQTA